MPPVTQRAAARRDLVEHFVHLAENAGLDVAERFFGSAVAVAPGEVDAAGGVRASGSRR